MFVASAKNAESLRSGTSRAPCLAAHSREQLIFRQEMLLIDKLWLTLL